MDTSDFINEGLNELPQTTYTCPMCGKKEEVFEYFNKSYKVMEPVNYIDMLCKNCDCWMDRR